MLVRAGLVLSIATLALAGSVAPARAEEPTARQFAAGVADRARRALSLGPLVGAGLAYAPTPEALEVPITFGLGVTLFKIPVAPGPTEIKEMITSRLRARVTARVKEMVAAGRPPPDEQELARIGAEILAGVRAEVLGQRPYPGRTLERPRFSLALEGAYLPRAGAWQARATFGIGIKVLTIGPTIAGYFGDARGLYLGGELAAHLTPRPRPRSHVIDVFLRVDGGVTSATEEAHQVGLGLRLLLDLI